MYGAADFSGGHATRRASVLAVLLFSQAIGLLVALAGSLLLASSPPEPADLLWGAAAGLAGAIGIAFLYTALATTPVAVASPVAAVTGAFLPALFGIISGERPGLLSWFGIAAAVPAIVLLTRSPARGGSSVSGDPVRRAVMLGLGAGAGFGLFYIAISRTARQSGLWPLVAARASTLATVALVGAVTGRSLSVGRDARRAALLAGLLDMGANIAFLLAARLGLLTVVTVISSLYPAPTVLLARIVSGERLTAGRIAGLAFALAAVACIGVGWLRFPADVHCTDGAPRRSALCGGAAEAPIGATPRGVFRGGGLRLLLVQ